MPKGKNLANFRATHDPATVVPAKITATLAAMAKEGPDTYEYEADFIRRAAISQTAIGRFREQYKDHVVQIPGKNSKRVWVATVKEAKKFREIVGDAGL
jgi:hypothetical protein